MNDLSITQEYMVCALYEKGTLSPNNQKAIACLIVGGILEMQLEKCISIENKKITVCTELPEHMSYLKPLYNVINQGKPIKADKVMEVYVASFSNKKLNELLEELINGLKVAGVIETVKAGLLGNKEKYIPKKEVVTNIIEKIRAELLEDGEVSEEVIALTALLDNAGQLKDYFSKYEQKELKEKLIEIRTSDAGKTVKEAIEYIDNLIAIIVASTVVTSSI